MCSQSICANCNIVLMNKLKTLFGALGMLSLVAPSALDVNAFAQTGENEVFKKIYELFPDQEIVDSEQITWGEYQIIEEQKLVKGTSILNMGSVDINKQSLKIQLLANSVEQCQLCLIKASSPFKCISSWCLGIIPSSTIYLGCKYEKLEPRLVEIEYKQGVESIEQVVNRYAHDYRHNCSNKALEHPSEIIHHLCPYSQSLSTEQAGGVERLSIIGTDIYNSELEEAVEFFDQYKIKIVQCRPHGLSLLNGKVKTYFAWLQNNGNALKCFKMCNQDDDQKLEEITYKCYDANRRDIKY